MKDLLQPSYAKLPLKKDKSIDFYDNEAPSKIPIGSIWKHPGGYSELKVKHLAIANTTKRPAPVIVILYSKRRKCLYTMPLDELLTSYVRVK